MAVCAVCGRLLPPGATSRRITCGDRCRKRRSRHLLALRPVEELSWREVAARLAQSDPQRWGPPPVEDDDLPNGLLDDYPFDGLSSQYSRRPG